MAVPVLATQLEGLLVVDDGPTVLSYEFIALKLAVCEQSVACPCSTTQEHIGCC